MNPQKRSLPVGMAILTALVVLGLVPMIIRYVKGLGAVSNLSDGRPWGFWISFDLYCGVALAAGGFTLAGWVYLFNRQRYHAVARPAVLTAFLGYTLVILALLVDLGQPWYIWHAIVYRNFHSPLFEVAICVMTYTAVLALEFSPAVFERFNWHLPLRAVRAVQIPLVIAGVVLSTLHQSSLGSMLLMMPEALHPLWYTPILPVLFLTSAIAVGPAMVIFETTLSTRVFGHKLPLDILGGLARAIPYILGIYLLLKVADLTFRGNLGLLFTAYPQNLLWWGELTVGVALPIVIFSRPNLRRNRRALLWGTALVILGLVLNRFNVSMLALAMRPGFTYSPHWMEVAISAGLVADALLVVWLAYRLLPIVAHEETAQPAGQPTPGPAARHQIQYGARVPQSLPLVARTSRERARLGRQARLSIEGPLKGLAYVVFLPLIGVTAILVIGIRRLALALQTSPKASSALRGHVQPAPRAAHRR